MFYLDLGSRSRRNAVWHVEPRIAQIARMGMGLVFIRGISEICGYGLDAGERDRIR
jgi:hypothetical protein